MVVSTLHNSKKYRKRSNYLALFSGGGSEIVRGGYFIGEIVLFAPLPINFDDDCECSCQNHVLLTVVPFDNHRMQQDGNHMTRRFLAASFLKTKHHKNVEKCVIDDVTNYNRR